MFGKLGFGEILLVLAVALVLFGPSRLPQMGKAVGEGIREFRNAFRTIGEDATGPEKRE